LLAENRSIGGLIIGHHAIEELSLRLRSDSHCRCLAICMEISETLNFSGGVSDRYSPASTGKHLNVVNDGLGRISLKRFGFA